jgi:sulfur transfer protein SufE/stress-induced morphogen
MMLCLATIALLQWVGAPRVLAPTRRQCSSSARASAVHANLGLTPELEQVVEMFKMVPDQKLRYQQLLFMAQKAKPMAAALKLPENKVPGCLSTVFVHATEGDAGKIYFDGDSDAMLTKGLVVMLTEGLSGHTVEEILRVDPKFIQEAGITASLTPGRNNGLLNMLALMKQKAKGIGAGETPAVAPASAPAAAAQPAGPVVVGGGAPVADTIIQKVCDKLRPISVKLVDNSAQHAGHASREGLADGETHFALEVVSDVFAPLSKVQRHQLIYVLLADELKGSVHALQIVARTSAE